MIAVKTKAIVVAICVATLWLIIAKIDNYIAKTMWDREFRSEYSILFAITIEMTLGLTVSYVILRPIDWPPLPTASKKYLFSFGIVISIFYFLLLWRPIYHGLSMNKSAFAQTSYVWISVIITAPIIEEIVFRGLVPSYMLRKGFHLTECMALSSAMFFLVHSPWQRAIEFNAIILTSAVCFFMARRICGNMIAPIALHSAMNFRMLLIVTAS